jgi:hypothetical protein
MKIMRNIFLNIIFIVAIVFVSLQKSFSWGGTGHKIINKKSVVHLPTSMQYFINQSAFLEAHASDADIRRNNNDTSFYSEWPRHFIDIDDYPNFQNLPRSLDTIIAMYGWERVKQNGINPWATAWILDSLTQQMQRGDWNTVYQTASDLGHYVGDAHQPLHNTVNYNGQLTGNNGIHSRYETTMINAHQGELLIASDSAMYIDFPLEYVFSFVLHSNSLIDSIFIADDSAKALSNGNYNDTYYNELWNRTKNFTKEQFQTATFDLASLFYTAWVNAGSPVPLSLQENTLQQKKFSLKQNYPNPFNPSTTLTFDLTTDAIVTLKVFNILGNEVASLFNNKQMLAGEHKIPFDASRLSNGVYFYRIYAQIDGQSKPMVQTKKMVLMK